MERLLLLVVVFVCCMEVKGLPYYGVCDGSLRLTGANAYSTKSGPDGTSPAFCSGNPPCACRQVVIDPPSHSH